MKWSEILSKDALDIARSLSLRAAHERAQGKTIYPAQGDIFRALTVTPPESVKVVIVGQDPYHGPGQANGLAFSVDKGVPFPPSLKNIFKELEEDTGIPYPQPGHGDLTPWAKQGVLLLNTVLTVEQGRANSHKDWDWQRFVLEVFKTCADLPQPVVFILWGGQARAFVAGLQLSSRENKVCLFSSHPSPLGATKGDSVIPAFIGSRPFSRTNWELIRMGSEPVDWRLD